MSKRKSTLERKAKKRKEREKRVRRERNLRQNLPRPPIEDLPELEEREETLALSPFDMERMLRRRFRSGSGPSFLGPLKAKLNDWLRSARRDRDAPEDAVELAQELAYRSMESRDRREAERLARQAVSLDPDCTDALSVLALLERDIESRIAGLKASIAAGARALGGPAYFGENKGHFWGLVLTRPYMRTREALADLLRVEGRPDQAAVEYEEMLELNPNDDQGVRSALLAIRLQQPDQAATKKLLETYPDDVSCVFLWGRVLAHFLAGDRVAARHAIQHARRFNPHFERALEGERLHERSDGAVVFGGESEAAEAWKLLSSAWKAAPGAIRWVRSGACITTEEERYRAIRSYDLPVAGLLTLGRPSMGTGWRNETLEDIGPEHTSELLRMLGDPALHEQEEDSPAVWAPIHALRALARLHVAEAVEPLLKLLRDFPDDDWVVDNVPTALVEIGPASLEAVKRLLPDRSASPDDGMAALELLEKLGAERPEIRDECVGAVVRELQNHAENEPEFNGALVAALVELGATEHASLIEAAYEAGSVDRTFCGEWEELRDQLGLPEGGGSR